MQAIQFSSYGPPDVMQVVEVDEPHPGPREIRIAVRASGLSTGEVRVRSGSLRTMISPAFPVRTGFDAAGVVDEVGDGVTGVAVGDEVFGMVAAGRRGANADVAVLVAWAPRPSGWTWEEAGAAAGSVETSVRVLDRLGVEDGQTVLVHGAAGATGLVVTQFVLARGAVALGTASPGNHGMLTSLGVQPTTYGAGLVDRVRALAPQGVDAAVDCAGVGLPDLVTIVGSPERVVTIADLGAPAHGVHLSHGAPANETGASSVPGADPLALHGLDLAVQLAEQHRLRIPVAASFPLDEAAAAHRLAETRHRPGRIVFTTFPARSNGASVP